jgi:hypothetical protein
MTITRYHGWAGQVASTWGGGIDDCHISPGGWLARLRGMDGMQWAYHGCAVTSCRIRCKPRDKCDSVPVRRRCFRLLFASVWVPVGRPGSHPMPNQHTHSSHIPLTSQPPGPFGIRPCKFGTDDRLHMTRLSKPGWCQGAVARMSLRRLLIPPQPSISCSSVRNTVYTFVGPSACQGLHVPSYSIYRRDRRDMSVSKIQLVSAGGIRHCPR